MIAKLFKGNFTCLAMKVDRNSISRYAGDILDFLSDKGVVSLESFFDCDEAIREIPYWASVELKKDAKNGRNLVLYKLSRAGIYIPVRATISDRKEGEINFALRCCEVVKGYTSRTRADTYDNFTQTKALPGNMWKDFIGELESLNNWPVTSVAKAS